MLSFVNDKVILILAKNCKENFIQNFCSRGQDCCDEGGRLNRTLSTRTSRDL